MITIFITLPMLAFLIYTANNTKQILMLEREKQLHSIANTLRTQLPDSFDNILAAHNATNLSDKEKRSVLHQVLQPIVNEISGKWPGCSMGYYSATLGRVAFTLDRYLLGQKTLPEEAVSVYKTKEPATYTLDCSITRDGGRVLATSIPILANYEVVGHIWVNFDLKDILTIYYRKIFEIFAFTLVIWLSLVLLIRYIFYRTHGVVSKILKSGIEKPEQLNEYPELVPLANTFFALQERERALERLRNNLEIIVQEKTTELTKTKNQLIDTLESISDGFCTVDSKWNFTYLNKTAEKLLGGNQKPLIGDYALDYISQTPLKQALFKAMEERTAQRWEGFSSRYNKYMELLLYPNNTDGGLTIYFKDIEQRKKAEHELARLDMLNLIGQIAAGISHEVRNPMTTVRGFLQNFIRKTAYERDKEVFQLMIDELDRANGIITEFLSAAKIKANEKKLNSLTNIVKSVKPLLDATVLEEGHEIKYELESEQGQINVDEKEIKQLILNLVRNSIEAMDKKGGITLGIVADTSGTTLLVADEGKGIPLEIIDKIGTPFFTTKDLGTGLGLSTCYGIASRHNANIDFATGPHGTTFLVHFEYAVRGKHLPLHYQPI